MSGFGFILTVLALQILLTVLTRLVVFRAMGKDYEAAVIAASFGESRLIDRDGHCEHDRCHPGAWRGAQGFVIVPLVGGFFIDLINAVVVSTMVGFS